MAEPPYTAIWEHLRKGQVIPFLGAGASLSGRPEAAVWDPRTASFLPNGRELAMRLAGEVSFPSPDPYERGDLAKVASYYEEVAVDRASLVDRLRDIFDKDYQIGEVHSFLADIPTPLLIITTNYDDLIERAFTRRSKPFHLVIHPTDSTEQAASVLWWKPGSSTPKYVPPSTLPLSLTDTTIIYKMHGSVDRRKENRDSFVITEEDYVTFLSRMTGQHAIPARFTLHFRACRFLFLGYGLRDWNFRVMLKNLKGAPTGSLRSWAIQFHPSELEQMLWQKREVNLYNMKLDTFIEKMRECM